MGKKEDLSKITLTAALFENEDEEQKAKEGFVLVLEDFCGDEFSKLCHKGCNEEELLSHLWGIHLWEMRDYSVRLTGATIKKVRKLQRDIKDVAFRIDQLNESPFGILLSEDRDRKTLRQLPERLYEYLEVSKLLTQKTYTKTGREYSALADDRAKLIYRLLVCRFIHYVRQKTRWYYDREVGKLVAYARGRLLVLDKNKKTLRPSDADQAGGHKTFRQRYYKDLKSYL
jgi:hypothetical protein